MGQGSRYTHTLPQHLWPVADLLSNAPVGSIPDPWSDIAYVAVGGLEAVGFETATERMLVVSSAGQSVIDCRTGQKVHRDHERSAYDPSTLTAWATNQDENHKIQMCGLHGGALRTVTNDGWSIDAIPIYWPKYFFVLNHPLGCLHVEPGAPGTHQHIGERLSVSCFWFLVVRQDPYQG